MALKSAGHYMEDQHSTTITTIAINTHQIPTTGATAALEHKEYAGIAEALIIWKGIVPTKERVIKEMMIKTRTLITYLSEP